MAKFFLIETYKGSRLIDINKDYPFTTKEAAENEVIRLYEEQKKDNSKLLEWQAAELEESLFDITIDDKIPAPAYQYNYTYKIATYGKRQIKMMP